MEETLEQSLGLLEFRRLSSFDGWKLVEIVNGAEGVVVNGITSWVGTSSLIWRIWVIGLNMFEESSEEHGIWKSHLTTLSHAHHSMDDVVGEVEGFADGETINHVAKRHVWMIFVTGETNDIFIKNESENGFDVVNSKPHANGSVKALNETETPIELKDEDGANLLVNVK
ncbi:hypothetical protein Tco_0186093 [Tanacetum coccineum]